MEPVEYQRMFDLEDRHWWFQGRLEMVRRMLTRHAPRATPGSVRLLDIGCGTGMFLQKQNPSWTTFGLDRSFQALRFTRQRGIGRLVCADSVALPFPNASFDVVTAFDLIEHVEGDCLLVSEVHRVLKPGGILLATVPAHPLLWSAHDRALHHKRRYRWKQFDSLFDEKLWIKRRMTWTFAAIYPVAALVRSAKNLLPLSGSASADTHMTSSWLNAFLIRLHFLEAALVDKINLPFGLSILTIREKRKDKSVI